MNAPAIKNKYNFADVSVLYRTENGYINLSDFDLAFYKDEQEYNFPMTAPFIIAVCLFDRRFLYTEVQDISELLTLADIRSEKFVTQIGTGLPETVKEQVLGQLCANKITHYDYGTIRQTKGLMNFEFCRLKYKKENGKLVKYYPPVLSKKFHIASKV